MRLNLLLMILNHVLKMIFNAYQKESGKSLDDVSITTVVDTHIKPKDNE